MIVLDGAAALAVLVDRDPTASAAVAGQPLWLGPAALLELAERLEARGSRREAWRELVVMLARAGLEVDGREAVSTALGLYGAGLPLGHALQLSQGPPRARHLTVDPARVEAARAAGADPLPTLPPPPVPTFQPPSEDDLAGLHPVVAVRIRLGLTRSDLARMLGVSHMLVAAWEEGHAEPEGETAELLRRMAGTEG